MESPASTPILPTLYAQVYQALDESIATNSCLARSEAQVQRALWSLRDSGDRETLAELELMSVNLSRLSIATRGSDQREREAVLERLRAAARSWMERLPIH
jgi:hypothetical protein